MAASAALAASPPNFALPSCRGAITVCSVFCGHSSKASMAANAAVSLHHRSVFSNSKTAANVAPFCGLITVQRWTGGSSSLFAVPGKCGGQTLKFCGCHGARLGLKNPRIPWHSKQRAGKGKRDGAAVRGASEIELKIGRAHISLNSGMALSCAAHLNNGAGKERIIGGDTQEHLMFRRRRNFTFKTGRDETGSLAFPAPRRVESEMKDPRGCLQEASARILSIWNICEKRLRWSLLQFAGIGGRSDSHDQRLKLEQSLCYQLHPVAKRRGLVFFITSAIIALIIVSSTPHSGLQPAWSLTQENLLFLEAWRTIDRAYVDKSFNGQSWFRYRENALRQEPMSTRQETYNAIRKMLATLDDPFTRFLDPEKFKSLKSGTDGTLTGVGLELGFNVSSGITTAEIAVVAPIHGGPAGRAGIAPGDLLLAIDGISTEGMGLFDAARLLRGPLKSQVELTVLNSDSAMPKKITVTREKVTLNPVSWKLCPVSKADKALSKLGYIRLSTFNENSTRAVKAAIEGLRNDGATSFVLDIRNNSGGLFPAGVEIAKMWLEKGVIVYITDSLGVRDIYEADGEDAIATTEPLTVLVNKGTASASEILAGALKDNNRAIIAGETTFGKGRIQSVFQLSDGSGMAVTVAQYETPGHINIDKVGISPDHLLSPDVLPMEESSFCSVVQDPSSPLRDSDLFSR